MSDTPSITELAKAAIEAREEGYTTHPALSNFEGADPARAILSLTSRVEMLEGALRPFAKMLTDWEGDGDTPPLHPRGQCEMNVSVAALHRARALTTVAKPATSKGNPDGN